MQQEKPESGVPAGPGPDNLQPEPLDPRAMVPYVAPMLTYLLLTQLESFIPEDRELSLYPIAYTIKIVMTLGVMIACRSAWRDLRALPSLTGYLAAIALGAVVTLIWVGLDQRYPPIPLLGGSRTAFELDELGTTSKWLFIAVRMLGLVILVPVFEELFWRSFLMRLVTNLDDFQKVPIGKVTLASAAITSIGFMVAHPEWLPALITGFAWAGLLAWTRSITACVISHFVANLTLGIYVIATGSWQFW